MVSVIIPVYNEKNHIDDVVEKIIFILRNNFTEYEIIIVDDGSVDGGVVNLRNDNRIKLITHKYKRGYGAAIKTGIENARWEFIVIIDGDGTYPAEDIPKLVESLKDNDMVVGARTGQVVKIPLFRRPVKWVLKKLANYLVEFKIPDLNSGFRVFKKSIAMKSFYILPNGFSFTTTITLIMHSERYNVKYIPINYFQRKGKSKISPIRDTLTFFQLIIRTILYFNPLKIFLPISLILFLASLLCLFYRLFIARALFTTAVSLFIAAIQILAIGMLADMINKKVR
ncbi:glycosyltransferase family 2 protein [bacterium]|nr:glycosyltransferase family 2 protein [bacterium]